MKRFTSLLIIIASAMVAFAHNSLSTTQRKLIADSLRAELSHARTSADSVITMCNLYDILPQTKSNPLGDSLIRTAQRAGDRATALNIIRNQAKRYMRNDSMLTVLQNITDKFSNGDDKKETLTFIRFMVNNRRALFSDTHDRDKAIKSYIEALNTTKGTDIYDRIGLLHGICMTLSEDTNGEIVLAYMDSLSSLINKLPASAWSIRNLYNLQAASLFANTQPRKSMEADLNNIKVFENMEKQYAEKGRIYRTYHPNYYDMYTRLLSNYHLLSQDEIEEFYHNAIEEASMDTDVEAIYEKTHLPDIYYHMAKKQYDKVLPLLKNTKDQELSKTTRLQMLRFAIEAARELGNKEELYEVTDKYAEALQERLDNLANTNYREMRIAYSMADMRNSLEHIELKQRQSHATLQRVIIAGSLCAVVLMAILIVFLLKLYRKNHQLAQNLKNANEQLMAESEKLRLSRNDLIRARDQAQKANNLKSDFIKNMSYEVKLPLQAINEYSHLIADCIAHSDLGSETQASSISTKHLTRFADLIELNSELLSTIIEDVLRLSEIESSSLPIQSQVIQLRLLCESTLASIRRRTKPGVTMTLDPNVPKLELFSDPTRVQQILNNLLVNATKFTDQGSIVLSYRLSDDGDNVVFSVTDTGIGINPENKEKIFERFVKLDRDTQGAGLGLTIARMLARNLGGDLTLDTTYTGGARFVLTIPKK